MEDFYYLKRDNNPLRQEAFTFSCLGKLHSASSLHFLKCGKYLSGLLDEVLLDENRKKDEILIIGLTESGVIPSLLMQQEASKKGFSTNLIYSTRRPLSGIPFKENHSHGPDHILPFPDCKIKEIWIVEDEITTGNTILNLMFQLLSYFKISSVRIFSFADFRTYEQKSEFISKIKQENIDCFLHTLDIFLEKEISSSLGSISSNLGSFSLNNLMKIPEFPIKAISTETLKGWYLPERRSSLGVTSNSLFNSELWQVPIEYRCGTILAVGESVDIAAYFILSNKDLCFQQVSLSPWKIDKVSIFSRIDFLNKYYLYNYKNLKDPVFIICDPIDKEIEIEVIKKLENHGINVQPFLPANTILNQNKENIALSILSPESNTQKEFSPTFR